MGKNGKLFISVINATDFVSSVWDPYAYRQNDESQTLSDLVNIHKVTVNNNPHKLSPFRPIEYKDIPPGSNYLSFALEYSSNSATVKLPSVGEGVLLFGTMRAYLGNIIVTPLAGWIKQEAPIYFSVKSEFAVISPHDELNYFWFAYMRSKQFLSNLPVGTGGTRPRLQPEALGQTPVTVPSFEIRKQIHQELIELARKEWENYSRIALTINSLMEQIYGSSLISVLSSLQETFDF